MMKRYTTQTLYTILHDLKEELKSHQQISFEVLNPDVLSHSYAGTLYTFDNEDYLYRGFKTWSDLAHLLFCRMKTPKLINDSIIQITFEKLDTTSSFHTKKVDKKEEKYGLDSGFALLHKNEESSFLVAYSEALKYINIASRTSILNLGVNRGDEFELIETMVSHDTFKKMNLVGIDHSHSAINEAKRRFSEPMHNFYAHDINDMHTLGLESFDLIISIGTLQSPSIPFKTFFMQLVQNYLKKGGAMILGFPNCRWIDGEMIYGAKAPNYSYSELSLVIKDIHFCKKYLQQKKFRVTVTGKDYLFLTATTIGS